MGFVIYSWDDCFNIDLRSNKVVWWNEDWICINLNSEKVLGGKQI